MSRPWQGEDLPFGTVIQADQVGTMMIVSPPTQPHVVRPNLGFSDHGAIWLVRVDHDTDAGDMTYLSDFHFESEFGWQIIEDPS